jgi:hypothetical protein
LALNLTIAAATPRAPPPGCLAIDRDFEGGRGKA